MMRTARAALKVAEREFVERVTSRAFLISNVVLVIAIVLAVTLPARIGGDGVTRIGYVAQAEQTARLAEQRASQLDTDVELVAVAGRAVARAAVRPPDQRDDTPNGVPADQLDAVLLDARTVLVWQDVPDQVNALLAAAARDSTIRSTLADTDLSDQQRETLLSPPPLVVDAVAPQQAQEGPALAVGGISILVLYGLLLFYGQFVAQGIVLEKSSRVVEVLLSTIRPSALLYGKIVGLTAVGLVQTLALAVVGVTTASLSGAVTIPSQAYGTIALVVGWFVLGFLLYATVFAVAASLVSRQEDLQSLLYPAMIPILVGFFVAEYALDNPESTVSLVAGLVPFTAPLVQPLRYAVGVLASWEIFVAIALSAVTFAALVPVAARFYSGSALRFGGRVGLGEAWRAARS